MSPSPGERNEMTTYLHRWVEPEWPGGRHFTLRDGGAASISYGFPDIGTVAAVIEFLN